MPPVSGVGVHGGEEARSAAPGAREGGTGVGVGPGVAAVGGAIDFVGPVGEAATHFVHAGDVDVARDRVAGDLDVADEGWVATVARWPSSSVVSGVGTKMAPPRH